MNFKQLSGDIYIEYAVISQTKPMPPPLSIINLFIIAKHNYFFFIFLEFCVILKFNTCDRRNF
mgnify:CR=1 FL=1